MISSVCGDIMGSAFEFDNNRKNTYNSLLSDTSTFTDDTILTIATADAILNNRPYGEVYYEYALRYPKKGYGRMFSEKVASGQLEPYDSYGNGSAMRVSPVAWAFEQSDMVLEEAKKSAECTHNHEEGIKGAQAIAYAIWLCNNQKLTVSGRKLEKPPVRFLIEERFGYDLSRATFDFEPKFDVTCQGTIPRCWAIFNETNNFEQAMRLAISMGGDVDTNCCIVGGLCDAAYGFPDEDIIKAVYEKLPTELSDVMTKFIRRFINVSWSPPLFANPMYTKNPILSLGDLNE
jgi:ADP-ribosylglycohydrolase